mmetsp:Transcript_9741/g.12059  ORF Transcript_9741/g.12059 Transcript_9741/m.12059 type:complete len:205 (-) Transcript_9741:28-642(-)
MIQSLSRCCHRKYHPYPYSRHHFHFQQSVKNWKSRSVKSNNSHSPNPSLYSECQPTSKFSLDSPQRSSSHHRPTHSLRRARHDPRPSKYDIEHHNKALETPSTSSVSHRHPLSTPAISRRPRTDTLTPHPFRRNSSSRHTTATRRSRQRMFSPRISFPVLSCTVVVLKIYRIVCSTNRSTWQFCHRSQSFYCPSRGASSSSSSF